MTFVILTDPLPRYVKLVTLFAQSNMRTMHSKFALKQGVETQLLKSAAVHVLSRPKSPAYPTQICFAHRKKTKVHPLHYKKSYTTGTDERALLAMLLMICGKQAAGGWSLNAVCA